ncbi:hypothetical protein OQA88_4513 [Cercophora sp. LCS_1]
MDGSYGNVYGGAPSMSPASPTSSNNEQYKVNVSRQKTRKWANFKPANYDGDDWGDEYDDGPEDTPPPAPSKPQGPRQLSASPSTPKLFAPGTPPLHLQTQRAASTPSGPVSAGGALERTGTETLASPQSAVPKSAAPAISALQPGASPTTSHPTTSLPLRARSPASPVSAGPVGNRFPPRKSSLGSHDAPPSAGSRSESQSGSRPSSSHNKPWTEVRSSSPSAHPRSPLASPAKPLPFIRPADIYRRMEEEKEKERGRRSMESAGRPSLDNIANPKQAQPETTVPVQKPVEESADVGRASRPSLAPVAERKSEYGLEGLIASYGSDDTPTDVEPTVIQAPSASSLLPSQSSKPASEEPKDGLRRYSTSPKLPELGRMSTFGSDLFSGGLAFSPDTPAVPPIPEATTNSPMASSPKPALPDVEPQKASAPATSNVVQKSAASRPVSAMVQAFEVRSAAASNEEDRANRRRSPERANAAQPGLNASRQQNPAAEPSRQAPPAESKHLTRPSLPGGWVTETLTPSEEQTPPSGNTPKIEEPAQASSTKDSPQASSTEAGELHKAEDTNNVVSEPKQASPQPASTPSHRASPLALTPLRTGSPALSAPIQMAASQPASELSDGEATPSKVGKDAAADVTSTVSTPAPTRGSEVPPTAPLNPSRSLQEVRLPVDFSSPPGFETSSTLETTSNSPLKESDVLREEIMKSLSPQSPSRDHLSATGGNTSAYHAAAGTDVRESAYLGDVYGDYWEAGEEKPAPPLTSNLATTSVGRPVKEVPEPKETTSQPPIEPAGQSPISPVKGPADVGLGDYQAAAGQPKPEGKAGGLHRQFSWEAPAPTAASPEQKPEELGSSNVEITRPKSESPEPHVPSVPKLDTSGLSSQSPSGGISHQVSGASSAPPRSTNDPPIEPPSPLSVTSEHHGPTDERELSQPEDKVLVQPVAAEPAISAPSPSAPAAQFDVLRSRTPSPNPDVPKPISKPLSTLTFRQILDLPTSKERAKAFNDTRMQFAAMDRGLNKWITTMISRHQEYATPTPLFNELGNTADSQQGPQAATDSPRGHHPNPSVIGFGQVGRPTMNVPMPPTPPHGSGGFGNASADLAQVGTKSKKLLMAAGKAGKGLLSKGKNKLSGTGDKVFFNS